MRNRRTLGPRTGRMMFVRKIKTVRAREIITPVARQVLLAASNEKVPTLQRTVNEPMVQTVVVVGNLWYPDITAGRHR